MCGNKDLKLSTDGTTTLSCQSMENSPVDKVKDVCAVKEILYY